MYLGKEHWLGLDNIYKLTNRKDVKTQLKIEYTLDNGGTTHTVTYDNFYLKDPVDDEYHIFSSNLSHISLPKLFWFQPTYRLHLGKFNGTGNKLTGNNRLQYHNNMAFTTFDHDQDNYSLNCAVVYASRGFEYVLWMTSCYCEIKVPQWHIEL